MKIAASAMAPGIAVYFSVQKSGRHEFPSRVKAVGNRCTKAVAMSTPVPKWRIAKKNGAGIRSPGKLTANMGNAHAVVETKRMMNKAPTCKGVLYTLSSTPLLTGQVERL